MAPVHLFLRLEYNASVVFAILPVREYIGEDQHHGEIPAAARAEAALQKLDEHPSQQKQAKAGRPFIAPHSEAGARAQAR